MTTRRHVLPRRFWRNFQFGRINARQQFIAESSMRRYERRYSDVVLVLLPVIYRADSDFRPPLTQP